MDKQDVMKTRNLTSDELKELKTLIQRIFTQDELEGLGEVLREPKKEDWTLWELEKLRAREAERLEGEHDEKRYMAAALRAYPNYGLSMPERLLLALIDAHPTHEPNASEALKQEIREDRLREATAIVLGQPRRESLRPVDDIARGWISDQLRRRAFQKLQHERFPAEERWKPDYAPESPGGLKWSEFRVSSLARAAVVQFYGLDPKSGLGNQVWERIRKALAPPEDMSSPEFYGWFHNDQRVDWAIEQVRDDKFLRIIDNLREIGVACVPNLPHGSPRDE